MYEYVSLVLLKYYHESDRFLHSILTQDCHHTIQFARFSQWFKSTSQQVMSPTTPDRFRQVPPFNLNWSSALVRPLA